MPTASRNERRKRRQRRTISLLTRQSNRLQEQFQKTHFTLLGVLAQSGGEVTVTKGTLQQVLDRLKFLNWQTIAGKEENEYVVRVIEAPEPAETVKDYSITRMEEQNGKEENNSAPDASSEDSLRVAESGEAVDSGGAEAV